MAGIKIVDLPALGRDLASTDLLELSLAGGTGSRKITGQEIMNASKLSINNTPIINGTVGRVLFQGTGDVLQQSSSLFWDNTNARLGIGTSTPNVPLEVVGSNLLGIRTQISVNNAFDSIQVRNSSTGDTNQVRIKFDNENTVSSSSGGVIFYTGNNYAFFPQNSFGFWNHTSNGVIALATNNTERFRIFSTGNVAINTTTDAGFRLDVNGTARFSGSVIAKGANASSQAASFVQDSGSNYLGFVKRGSSEIGNMGLPAGSAEIQNFNNGALGIWTISNYIAFGTSSTERMRLVVGTGNVLINTTTDDGFKLDVNGTARVVGPTFAVGDWTQRSTSVYVRALTGGAENRGFYIGVGASNDGNAGSFTYQQTTGMLNIRSPYNSGTIALSFEGNTNSVQFHNQTGTAVSKFFSGTGNFGINTTTDAGFRLDVNGTARVKGTGTTSATNALSIQDSAGANTLLVKDDKSVFLSSLTTGGATSVTDQQAGRLYFESASQWHSYIGSTRNAGTGDTSLALFGLGTGGQYHGGIRFFTSSNSATPVLAMIVDRNQSVGIGLTNSTNLTVNSSAKLQVDSTTQGFLPPRMTQAQRNAIASPAIGLEIYQTDATEGKYIYKSSGWTYIG